MKLWILGRWRWYYSRKIWAKARALWFRLQGIYTMISTVYLLKNGECESYYIGNYVVKERPENAMDGIWYRVMIIPSPSERGGYFARGC